MPTTRRTRNGVGSIVHTFRAKPLAVPAFVIRLDLGFAYAVHVPGLS